MGDIKLWLLTICVYSAVISVFKIFVPSGNIKKAGEIALSLIMVFIIIYSISSVKNDIRLSDNLVSDDIFSDTTDSCNTAYREAINKSISTALEQKNIFADKITFDMNNKGGEYIEISNVCLSIQNSELSDDEIKSAVSEYTGFSDEIISVIRD